MTDQMAVLDDFRLVSAFSAQESRISINNGVVSIRTLCPPIRSMWDKFGVKKCRDVKWVRTVLTCVRVKVGSRPSPCPRGIASQTLA